VKPQVAPLFSARILAGWIAAAAVTVAISLVLASHNPTSTNEPDAAGPTVYSTSAIGYDALFHTLDALGIPVSTSETIPTAFNDVVVLAEPDSDPATLEHVRNVLNAGQKIVVILPKRTGVPDPDRPNRLRSDTLRPIGDALAVLHLIDPNASLIEAAGRAWRVRPPVTPAPALRGVQLASSTTLTSLLGTSAGMLVGRLGGYGGYGKQIVVITDPDIVDNHGIARGDNALIVREILDDMRVESGSVVFDESIHGYSSSPYSALLLLFRFPFVLITLQLVTAALLLIWSGSGRFGAPKPRAPALAAGKQSLIESGAALLEFGASPAFLAERYADAIVHDAGQNLHAPRGLAGNALNRWLTTIGRPMPASPGPAGTAHAAVAACQALFRWRNETLDEPR
jgi:uncharacterized protein DUF4350